LEVDMKRMSVGSLEVELDMTDSSVGCLIERLIVTVATEFS
jgi:hypothetical protein